MYLKKEYLGLEVKHCLEKHFDPQVYNNQVHGPLDIKVAARGLPSSALKQACAACASENGGLAGRAAPLSISKHYARMIIGFERIRSICFEAGLHGLKEREEGGVGGGAAPPPPFHLRTHCLHEWVWNRLQTQCQHDGLECFSWIPMNDE